jgi:hypothetical protein
MTHRPSIRPAILPSVHNPESEIVWGGDWFYVDTYGIEWKLVRTDDPEQPLTILKWRLP